MGMVGIEMTSFIAVIGAAGFNWLALEPFKILQAGSLF
jgi:hypothetical protein